MKNPRYWDMRSCGEPYLDLFIAIVNLAHSDATNKTDWLRYDARLFLRWAEEELAPTAAFPLCRQLRSGRTHWAPDDNQKNAQRRRRLANANQKECDG